MLKIMDNNELGKEIFRRLDLAINQEVRVDRFHIESFLGIYFEIRKHRHTRSIKSNIASPMITKGLNSMGLGEGDTVIVGYSLDAECIVPFGICRDQREMDDMCGRIYSMSQSSICGAFELTNESVSGLAA